ncbi:hypothetical protein ACWC6I_15750 [Streptomyces sp. NPDC001414]
MPFEDVDPWGSARAAWASGSGVVDEFVEIRLIEQADGRRQHSGCRDGVAWGSVANRAGASAKGLDVLAHQILGIRLDVVPTERPGRAENGGDHPKISEK